MRSKAQHYRVARGHMSIDTCRDMASPPEVRSAMALRLRPQVGPSSGSKQNPANWPGSMASHKSSADGCGHEGRTSAPASRCQARRHHWLPAMGQVANGQIHLTADQSTSPCRHHAHPHGATCASSSSLETRAQPPCLIVAAWLSMPRHYNILTRGP